jgi:hypothetical protein
MVNNAAQYSTVLNDSFSRHMYELVALAHSMSQAQLHHSTEIMSLHTHYHYIAKSIYPSHPAQLVLQDLYDTTCTFVFLSLLLDMLLEPIETTLNLER